MCRANVGILDVLNCDAATAACRNNALEGAILDVELVMVDANNVEICSTFSGEVDG